MKSRKGRDFYEATVERNFEHVTHSTHEIGNVLDFVLCNRKDVIKCDLDGGTNWQERP